jgi:hypothetical protein
MGELTLRENVADLGNPDKYRAKKRLCPLFLGTK